MPERPNRSMKVFVIATVVLSIAGYAATELLQNSTPDKGPSHGPASACGPLPTPSPSRGEVGELLDPRSIDPQPEPGHAVAYRCAEDDGWLFTG